ncbi:hypothetical protein WDW89_22370 [Deltaproteobacteria bacterium TL4]
MTIRILTAVWTLFWFNIALGNELGFLETFSLASNRQAALKQLIPGTEDYYYYHSLHAQNEGQWDHLAQYLEPWIKRYGYTLQVNEILNRQALFEYPQNPQKSLDYLKRKLGLYFNHQKEVTRQQSNFPSKLDESLIEWNQLLERALTRYQGLQDFENQGIEYLDAGSLDPKRQRQFLQRLETPDYPNLARWIVSDLRFEHSSGFGSHPIHGRLTLSQLQECARQMPELLNHSVFINTYLKRLWPSDDVNWQQNIPEKEAYYDRLWQFVKSLPPSQNSLKAHVLYHRLFHDRSQGVLDKARFTEYIKLPKQSNYANPQYFNHYQNRQFQANLGTNYQEVTQLPPITDDEPLIRDYLQYFFVKAEGYESYRDYFQESYLKALFAETKLLHGVGDAEAWYSLLSPEKVHELQEQVVLQLAPLNKEWFGSQEPVRLSVSVKNVKTLLVKIYQINTLNYYKQNNKEIPLDINLEGLVAKEEKTYPYEEVPLRQVLRHFEFPSLEKSGTAIIEFIGNGKSSRALIRKGRLYFVQKQSASGHEFTLFDERFNLLKSGSIWLSGHHYTADSTGHILVPYTNRPQRTSIILQAKDRATLSHFQHASEAYSLSAGLYVDREHLLRHQKAKVLIKPSLLINNNPISLNLLKNPGLQIETVDHDGVKVLKEVPNIQLFEDQETLYEFQVPPRLSTLQLRLKGEVQNLSQNKTETLEASSIFSFNQLDATSQTEVFYLSQVDDTYRLELLGKSGEAQAGRTVTVQLKHKYFHEMIYALLQTDQNGIIQLGKLLNIDWITANIDQSQSSKPQRFSLEQDHYSYPLSIHAKANSPLSIPYIGPQNTLTRQQVALFEKRGSDLFNNHFERLKLEKGFLEIQGLAPGNYELHLKQARQVIDVRVTQGVEKQDYLLSERRLLQFRERPFLHISDIKATTKQISIQLANYSKFSRVHVIATRFVPDFSVFKPLIPRQTTLSTQQFSQPQSRYHSERRIGDEVQYILDRQLFNPYPGNMLKHPSLLLNPMNLSQTETQTQQASEGEPLYDREEGRDVANRLSKQRSLPVPQNESFVNLDFLSKTSVVLTNLRPNSQGRLSLDPQQFAGYSQLHIVAVDPENTVYRKVKLTEVQNNFQDVRLQTPLESEKHYSEQKQIAVIPAGKLFVLKDISTSTFEAYDQLSEVYQLFLTLNPDAKLTEFQFVTQWQELTKDQKLEKYSKYASHELHFFLFKKDPVFFNQVVHPYLQHKQHKTFLDQWFLKDDLSSYQRLWPYTQLNTVEQILLAQRIPEEAKATLRTITDRYDLLPPDLEREHLLFKTALSRSSLDVGGKLGFADAKQKALQMKKASLRDEFSSIKETAPAPAGFETEAASEAKANRPSAMAPQMMAASPASKRKGGREGEQFYKKEEKRRQLVRPFYRKLEKTQEWVENNYYNLVPELQNASLIQVNRFWKDYARHNKETLFLSKYIAEASLNFSEIMFALSVLELPDKAEEHKVEYKGTQMELTAKSPMIVYYKAIQETPLVEDKVPLLINQHYFNYNDRYRYVSNERQEKYVTGEFLIHTVYGTQVVITNPTASQKKLDVLMQIPQGAVPVLNGFYTRSFHWKIEPYSTKQFEYHFYFPKSGLYSHYPAHVADKEQIIAYSSPSTIKVVERPTQVDKDSWNYISQSASDEEVLAFLYKNNLHRLDLNRIAFRMRNQEFFKQVLVLLDTFHVYNDTLWSYSIYHDDKTRLKDYLEHSSLLQQSGEFLESLLVTIDPIERKTYQHREYWPLVNARVHQLGSSRQLLNQRLFQQYQKFLKIMSYRTSLNSSDFMALSYYMLLQGRIDSALDAYRQVEAKKISTQLQYDYLTAYLAFYRLNYEQAHAIATRYQEYPVLRWKNAFLEILQQLKEAGGESTSVVNSEDRSELQTQLASTEPSYDFEVQGKHMVIRYQNIKQCGIHYYPMDIELLFSRNPFVKQYSGQFAYVTPSSSTTLSLPKDQKETTAALPAQFNNQNVMIELDCHGLTQSKMSYSHALVIQLIENYGHLAVTHQKTGKPLPMVYIKVYAQMKEGGVQFYKDGYTDIRGRFDYTSLNTDELDQVDKFALLVLSKTDGATIREAHPPKR